MNDSIGELRVAVQFRNRLLREAIAGQLGQEPGLCVVGTTNQGEELRRLCELRRPDIVVFEAGGDEGQIAQLVTQLRTRHRGIHLVGVYADPDPNAAVRLQLAGASRLVSCSSGLEALIAAVRQPVWCRPTLDSTSGRVVMTDREVRILHLISAGHTVDQIAVDLGITPRTVENYKRRIFAKLDAHSQAHAMACAARFGLLPASMATKPLVQPDPVYDFPTVGLVRGRAGRLVERVAEILLAQGIPLIVERSDQTSAADSRARNARGVTMVVLVDPDGDDWGILQDMAARTVLVVSRELDQAGMVDAVLCGANAIVPATGLPETLVQAYHLVAAGYLLVNAMQARKFIEAGFIRLSRRGPLVPLELTRREHEILDSIADGHSVKQTARSLGISVKTVESLQSRLFRKLGIRNRAEALVVAYGLGLVPLDGQDITVARTSDDGQPARVP